VIAATGKECDARCVRVTVIVDVFFFFFFAYTLMPLARLPFANVMFVQVIAFAASTRQRDTQR